MNPALRKQIMNAKASAIRHRTARFFENTPLNLECGAQLSGIEVAYETYGALNAEKSNAILICHALTGDQYVASKHPVTGKPGWWSAVVGPGKIIDTDRFFVVCTNILGGCMGTTGPGSLNPETGAPYGPDFPVVTIGDMVNVQKTLVSSFGIDRLLAVVGGSMGGMQVLEWAASHPEMTSAAVVIAAAARHTTQNIAFHELGRQAIMADPDWDKGRYEVESQPRRGLSVARMAAHITYLSESALHRKFGRNLQDRDALTYGFDADFQIESYLRHQGITFVDRFDANSYLYITRAMDYFDLAARKNGNLAAVFQNAPVRFCVVSFSSDWLFPTSESRKLTAALLAGGAKSVSFAEIESDKGHDAFLLDEPEFHALLDGFIEDCAAREGLPAKDKTPSIAPDTRKTPSRPSPRNIRIDQKLLGDMIPKGSKILDIGCGDGALLHYLQEEKNTDAAGMEISMDGVRRCMEKGLAVFQGDADTDLEIFPDKSFDYAVLSHTLQAMHNPAHVLEQMIRISGRAIVSFPNFGHWGIRCALGLGGRMPVNGTIPYEWYETPNIHFCTLNDFEILCGQLKLSIDEKIILDEQGRPLEKKWYRFLPDNLRGVQALYLLSCG